MLSATVKLSRPGTTSNVMTWLWPSRTTTRHGVPFRSARAPACSSGSERYWSAPVGVSAGMVVDGATAVEGGAVFDGVVVDGAVLVGAVVEGVVDSGAVEGRVVVVVVGTGSSWASRSASSSFASSAVVDSSPPPPCVASSVEVASWVGSGSLSQNANPPIRNATTANAPTVVAIFRRWLRAAAFA